MKTRRSLAAFLLTLFTVGCALGYAQQPSGTTTSPPPLGRYANWTSLESSFTTWHGKLLLTLAEHPKKRIACNLSRITDDAITCHRGALADAVYPRQSIATITSPAYHPWSSKVIGLFLVAGSGGLAFFANFFGVAVLAASIPLWYLSIIVLVAALLASSDPESSRAEVLLYQQP
jgi:hypothetical protein